MKVESIKNSTTLIINLLLFVLFLAMGVLVFLHNAS